jgi:coenzyme F420-reducing hydrogenase delta subunit
MYNMSAAQGPRFVEVANEMTEKIKELGPSPIKKNKSSQDSVRDA